MLLAKFMLYSHVLFIVIGLFGMVKQHIEYMNQVKEM